MRRLLPFFVMLFLAGAAQSAHAGPFQTTGYTFEVPLIPLHNVYVVTSGPANIGAVVFDLFLPPATIYGTEVVDGVDTNDIVIPAGFSVPVGISEFDLEPLGIRGAPAVSDRWAVVGLVTGSVDGQEHLVVATNSDLSALTPLDIFSPAFTCFISEAQIIALLQAGEPATFGADCGTLVSLAAALHGGDFMTAFGEAAQLWTFSTGQVISGASVTANALGVPIQATPSPATLVLLIAGLVVGGATAASRTWLKRRTTEP